MTSVAAALRINNGVSLNQIDLYQKYSCLKIVTFVYCEGGTMFENIVYWLHGEHYD